MPMLKNVESYRHSDQIRLHVTSSERMGDSYSMGVNKEISRSFLYIQPHRIQTTNMSDQTQVSPSSHLTLLPSSLVPQNQPSPVTRLTHPVPTIRKHHRRRFGVQPQRP
jgi:hypothetical protein